MTQEIDDADAKLEQQQSAKTANGSTMAKQVEIDPNRIGRRGHRLMGAIEATEAWIEALAVMAQNVPQPQVSVGPVSEVDKRIAEKQREVLEGLAKAMTAQSEGFKRNLMAIGRERGAITVKGNIILPGVGVGFDA